MKNQKPVWASIIMAVLFVSGCLSNKPSRVITIQPTMSNEASPSIVPVSTNFLSKNTIPLAFNTVPAAPPQRTNISFLNPASTGISNASGSATETETNVQTQYEKYQKGQISKGEMMQSVWAANNHTPQNLYGKVVDQYGEPVIGADVTGSIELIQGFDVGEKYETYKTKSDTNGLFQFTGLKGSRLDADVEKKGYEIDYRIAKKDPSGLKTTPADRMIYTMWKLKGAEPMAHVKFDSRVPYDGTSASFDLMKGKKVANSDLRITLLRNPLQIQRGRDKFDWIVKIEMLEGLQPENDLYPNWAPDNGYQSSFEANMKAADAPWSQNLNQNFYFKNVKGQYGRLFIDLSADSMRPDTGITIETWLNPSGSQNLEFDPAKQVR